MKYWLVLYSKEKRRYFTKYFDKESEINKYINRIKYIKNLILIEDSRDIDYGGYDLCID